MYDRANEDRPPTRCHYAIQHGMDLTRCPFVESVHQVKPDTRYCWVCERRFARDEDENSESSSVLHPPEQSPETREEEEQH
jgi:hypothetical protein